MDGEGLKFEVRCFKFFFFFKNAALDGQAVYTDGADGTHPLMILMFWWDLLSPKARVVEALSAILHKECIENELDFKKIIIILRIIHVNYKVILSKR